MKDYLGWIILSVSIVIAAIIYACATRYEYVPVSAGVPYVLDRWTGKTEFARDLN